MCAQVITILDKQSVWEYGVKSIYDVVANEAIAKHKKNYSRRFRTPGYEPLKDAKVMEYIENNTPPSLNEMSEADKQMWIAKVIKLNKIKLENGDVIRINGEDYRNAGIMFWNANTNKFVYPCTEICDYGHIPKCFKIGNNEGEFSPNHWNGISEYNNLQPVWLSDEVLNEIKGNMTSDKCSVTIKGEVFKILIGDAEKFKPYGYCYDENSITMGC